MKQTIYLVTIFSLLSTSCAQNSSTVEKEYIETLEKKNKALEKELEQAKAEMKNISQGGKSDKKYPKGYFTIGSTEDEVLEVMGDPTSYHDMGSIGKQFYYGLSLVVFEKGKVVSYRNTDDNLKVKVRK